MGELREKVWTETIACQTIPFGLQEKLILQKFVFLSSACTITIHKTVDNIRTLWMVKNDLSFGNWYQYIGKPIPYDLVQLILMLLRVYRLPKLYL